MKLQGVSFPEAVNRLAGGLMATRNPPPKLATKPPPVREPSGLREADALDLVNEAADRLWKPEGAEALAYLTGVRCLHHATIRTARLGWTPRADGVAWNPPGIVIPWFHEDRLMVVKVRPSVEWRERFPPRNRPPKYLEAFRNPARLVCYPSPATIRPGFPLVVVEGEFDALALGEALAGLAVVVTLGSASARPNPLSLGRFLSAVPWFVSTDADEAGDKAAGGWPARAWRVRPPEPYKDWTEARADGVNLARWWSDILAGNPRPELFTWSELSRWRWGSETQSETETTTNHDSGTHDL